MPIRFRCPHCTRLLGIARRKAGARINCPQCSQPVTVPGQEGAGELEELDVLLGNGAAQASAYPTPAVPDPEPGRPAVAVGHGDPPAARSNRPVEAPKPHPPRPRPHRTGTEDDPLFEETDVDALLGVKKTGALDLDEEPGTGPKPVSGLDAMSLDESPGKIVLSSQKATMLVVALVLLMGAAFAAGFLLASNL